ncbi:hypothetical protein ACFO0N_09005 [Halobium salinum]|uniref:PIN domain-containing protein n=1 Tax=Halobium salinum TaxID=1364940 RepID=A0ABD5PC87_9EURY|nr:hypothetical protein [Halobium salinum]
MTETWADLFGRAAAFDADEAAVRAALERRRERDHADRAGGDDGEGATPGPSEPPDPTPARVVADADVLVADLLVGGDARRALDALREHSWTTLVASDALLDDAEAVLGAVADDALAADWRERVEAWREPASHPAGDHPALGSAYRGGAMHLLTLDPRLQTAQAGAKLKKRVEMSVRHPRAFATLFDGAKLYPTVVDEGGDEEYPGPDRDPRA